MADRPLTLMAVHAHPDDEATGTGGVLAKYASEGIRTVLVTCTNGELGDGPGGVKPGDPGHDPAEIVDLRRGELEASCRILGVSNLHLLGFHDSGMMGWPQNDEPGAFWNTPVADAAKPLVGLMEEYRPHVVITYDEHGFYGHPDHIQANRITLAAIELTGIPEKLYYTAVPRSVIKGFVERIREHGIEPPGPVEEDPEFGTPDELIGSVIDCSPFVDRKFDSLATHASQSDNIIFLDMGRELFAEVFSTETFVRVHDRTDSPLPESDLFAGLR